MILFSLLRETLLTVHLSSLVDLFLGEREACNLHLYVGLTLPGFTFADRDTELVLEGDLSLKSELETSYQQMFERLSWLFGTSIYYFVTYAES